MVALSHLSNPTDAIRLWLSPEQKTCRMNRSRKTRVRSCSTGARPKFRGQGQITEPIVACTSLPFPKVKAYNGPFVSDVVVVTKQESAVWDDVGVDSAC